MIYKVDDLSTVLPACVAPTTGSLPNANGLGQYNSRWFKARAVVEARCHCLSGSAIDVSYRVVSRLSASMVYGHQHAVSRIACAVSRTARSLPN